MSSRPSQKNVIAIRADSGWRIGSGHVYRCLHVARSLSKAGFQPVFITRPHEGYLDLSESEIPFLILPVRPTSSPLSSQDYRDWLGCTQAEDLKDCIDLLEKNHLEPEAVIVDHYGLSSAWMKDFPAKLKVQIDDLGRPHCADVLIDSNLTANLEDYKKVADDPKTQYLLGPSFALLASDFTSNHLRAILVNDPLGVSQICVYYGFADIGGHTIKATQGILDSRYSGDVHVILRKDHSDFDEIGKISRGHPRFYLHEFVTHIAPFYAKNHLAFGASGVSMLERACVGLPTCYSSVADNQNHLARAYEQRDLGFFMPEVKPKTVQDFMDQIPHIDFKPLRRRLLDLVDGQGVSRVCKVIQEHLRK